MDVPQDSPETCQSSNGFSVEETNNCQHSVQTPFACSGVSTAMDNGVSFCNQKKKKRKKKDRVFTDDCTPSCSSSSWSQSSSHKGIRISSKRRNPKIFVQSARRSETDLDVIALPLGMSIAAVVSQVLERRNAAAGSIPVDHLSAICTSAVRESLANVFGEKFDSFLRNFEKSFGSTLSTLRLINESSHCSNTKGPCSEVSQPLSLNEGGFQPEPVSPNSQTTEDIQETVHINTNRELTVHAQINNQLGLFSQNSDWSTLSTFEKSVVEQARSNDLKAVEIGLTMKKLRLKETELALSSDSNLLERFKLSMGISKAYFKAEKFKTQLEDTRHADLFKKCIDCLVAGLLIMLASLGYGAYVYSYKRIAEATSSCTPPQELKSWWVPKPVASLNSVFYILICQVQIITRMLFGFLMVLGIAFLLIQRSGTAKQTMPITFILLLLGIVCGLAGKLCVDTLGGNGYHWLLYWEVLCFIHFFANIWISALFFILHGPITGSQVSTGKSTFFPYWIRRFLFYATSVLLLPLLCGLMPFAGPGEWKDHFYLLTTDYI